MEFCNYICKLIMSQTNKRGIVLMNLGSPDSTSVKDVRRYLNEFLMDEKVIDIPNRLRLNVAWYRANSL